MSETTTATPEPAVTGAAGADNLSFADAFDVGFEALEKSPSPEATSVQTATAVIAPAESVKNAEVSKTDASSSTNPLDVLTKRLTGQEESKVETLIDDADVKAPENLKPEAQTAWARLTKDLRDARSKLKELETKTAEAPVN